MKYGKVLKFEFYSKVLGFIIKNRLLLILSLSLMIGFAVAVFGFGDNAEINEFIKSYLSDYVALRQDGTFFKIFFESFMCYALFLSFGFVFSTSMFGVILIPILLFVRGYLYGCVSAYLYSAYSFEGVAFHAVVMLLPAVLFSAALILSSVDGMNFSYRLSRLTFTQNSSSDLVLEFKGYCIKLLLFGILVL